MFLHQVFGSYWELYHNVIFDGSNRLIIINDGVETIDVQRDLYSAWKEWTLVETNSRYLQAFNIIGGEPTIQGQFLDVTYFLINGWRIKPFSGNYSLNIIGNIFDVDGANIIVPADVLDNIPNNININTNTSVIVRKIDGGGNLSCNELNEINAKLDEQSGVQLYNIENRLLSIETTNSTITDLLSNPLEAFLVPSQENMMIDIYNKVLDMWKIHGLSTHPVTVDKDGRTVDGITQVFTNGTDDVVINRV